MKCVLTIAGYDPSSGAGATADLMVFAAHGLFGTSCITGLTVQSTMGVLASHPIDAKVVRETLNCLHADLPAAGIKIGMLGTAAVVATVADFLARLRVQGSRVPVVLDPVLRSSSGRELLDDEGMVLLRERLLRHVLLHRLPDQRGFPSTHASRLFGGRLVLRFRSSYHIAAPSFTNFGIKGALANYMI